MKYFGYYFAAYAVMLLIFGSPDFIPCGIYALFLIGAGLVLESL